MKIYEYLFYRIYMQMQKTLDKRGSASASSLMYSAPLILNILTLNLFIHKYIDVIPMLLNSKISAVIFTAIIMVLNRFYFLRNEKFLAIEERYKDETKTHRIIGELGTIIYYIASFILFGIMAFHQNRVSGIVP